MNRPTLFTIGYGMHNKPLCSRTDLLRECLEDAEVSVLLDIRDSPWGGYWNPKKFLEIFEESPIQYLLKDESIVWHKLFGASRKLRTMVSEWNAFYDSYNRELEEKDPNALKLLLSLVETHHRVAIMCCEPYVSTHDNCHRFIVAEGVVQEKLLYPEQVIHLDLDASHPNT